MSSTNGVLAGEPTSRVESGREAAFRVLVDAKGRHAIWPGRQAAPVGWTVAFSSARREDCLAFVRERWTRRKSAPRSSMGFGLMFFGGGETHSATSKYELIVECARQADAQGFRGMWLPERHFNPFGCLYPNPVILHAAMARETTRLRLRAGSVVLPLHQPIRVAEDWAILDNLSGGRVEISFAPGWSPDDFAFFPERYNRRYEELYAGIDTVRRLWRGEAIRATNGRMEAFDLRIYPRPLQPELPTWVTAAQSDESFKQAGAAGVDLLTHLFDQDANTLAEKIGLYREARKQNGHDPESGRVAVALHTYVGADWGEVQSVALPAYSQYLKTNLGMLKSLGQSRGRQLDLSGLSDRDVDDAIAGLIEKFIADRSLLGTPDSCVKLVRRLEEIGVAEIACLVDFGPDPESIRNSFKNLCELKTRTETTSPPPHTT